MEHGRLEEDEKQYLLDAVYSIINIFDQFILSGDIETDFQVLLLRLDYLQRLLVNLNIDDSITENVGRAYNILFNLNQIRQGHAIEGGRNTAPIVNSGRRGRPTYDIKEEQLSFLLENGFKVADMSKVIGVSQRTVERRMAVFGLSVGGNDVFYNFYHLFILQKEGNLQRGL